MLKTKNDGKLGGVQAAAQKGVSRNKWDKYFVLDGAADYRKILQDAQEMERKGEYVSVDSVVSGYIARLDRTLDQKKLLRLARALARQGDYDNAAKAYRVIGMAEKSADMLMKCGGCWHDASRIYQELGLKEKLGDVEFLMKKYWNAANSYISAGKLKKARRCAKTCEKEGGEDNIKTAAAIYCNMGCISEGAALLEKHGLYRLAAIEYLRLDGITGLMLMSRKVDEMCRLGGFSKQQVINHLRIARLL